MAARPPCCSVSRASFGTTPHHQKWLNTDAAGLFNLVVTWVLLVGVGGFYVNKYIIPRMFEENTLQWHSMAFNTILTLAFVSHVRVAFTDPGTIPLDAEPTPQTISSGATLYRCKRCRNFKPPRAHHCRICNRCITKMDHHCPWVNNCVGVSNQKFFFLFLGYALVVCTYGIALMVKLLLSPVDALDGGRVTALGDDLAAAGSDSDVTLDRGPTALEPGVESPLVPIVVLVIATCAAIFVCVMLRDQLKSLFEGVAKIDRLKNQQAKTQSNGVESGSSSGPLSNGASAIQAVENDQDSAQSKLPRNHLWLRRLFPQFHFPEVFGDIYGLTPWSLAHAALPLAPRFTDFHQMCGYVIDPTSQTDVEAPSSPQQLRSNANS